MIADAPTRKAPAAAETEAAPARRPPLDQRAHPRVPLYHDAMLSGGVLEGHLCRIRDFCRGGLFLSVDGMATELQYSPDRPLARGDAVTVHFLAKAAGRPVTFAMKATVARVLSKGLGVMFIDPEAEALEALEQLARECPGPTDSAVVGTSRYDAQLVSCGALAERHIVSICSALALRGEQALFAAARDAHSNNAQRILFEAQTALAQQSDDWRRRVIQMVRRRLTALRGLPVEDEPTSAVKTAAADLSLVDKREFEEFLAGAELIDRIEPRFKTVLFELEERLKAMLGRTPDRSENPFAPATVCAAFTEALRDVTHDLDALRVLYTALGDTLAALLGSLYSDLNENLKAAGVLPVVVSTVRQTTRRSMPVPPMPSLGEAPAPMPQSPYPDAGDFPAAPPFPGGAYPYHPAAGVTPGAAPAFVPPSHVPAAAGAPYVASVPGAWASHPGAYVGTYSQQTSPAYPAPHYPPPPAAGLEPGRQALHGGAAPGFAPGAQNAWPTSAAAVVPGPSPLQTARTLFNLRRELGRRTGALSGGAAAEAYGPNPASASDGGLPSSGIGLPPAWPVEALVAALDRVDFATASLDQGAGNPAAFEQLRDRLEATLAADETRGEAHRIEPSHLESLELVSELFGALLRDPRVAPEIRPLLGRLRAPMQQVALSEPDILDRGDHPAREMLERVAAVRSLDGTDPTRPVGPRLERIIELVHREAAKRPEVFRDAASEVSDIVAEQSRVFAENMASLARAADENNQVVRARRKPGYEAEQAERLSRLPPEMKPFLARAQALRPGDRVDLVHGRQTRNATLAWVDPDHQQFLFADALGRKITTLGLQELVMQMRRGTASVIEPSDTPVVERAVLSSLQGIQQRLERQSALDASTGALTAKGFRLAVEAAAGRIAGEGLTFTVGHVGIDEFEYLTDAGGDGVVVGLVREAATRLLTNGSGSVTVGRLDGGEFGILFEDLSQGEGYARVDGLREALARTPLSLASEPIEITASAGMTRMTRVGTDAQRTLDTARAALAAARAAGGNCTRLHDLEAEHLPARPVGRWLGEALDRDALGFAFLPLRPLAGAAAAHREAVAWIADMNDGSRIGGGELREAAAMVGRAAELDRWLLRTTLALLAGDDSDGWVLVRISVDTQQDASFQDFVAALLLESPVPPGRLCFEISDSTELGRGGALDDLVRQLKEFGCRFAIGDFGSDRASFAATRDLRLDLARIDRMGSRDIVNDRHDAVLLRSIVEMSHFLSLPVLADDVRTPELLARLTELGIDYAQGPAVSELVVVDRART